GAGSQHLSRRARAGAPGAPARPRRRRARSYHRRRTRPVRGDGARRPPDVRGADPGHGRPRAEHHGSDRAHRRDRRRRGPRPLRPARRRPGADRLVSGAALRHEVGADAAVAVSIEHCVHVLRERLGSRLVGIVLTGSFARGEGTVVPIDGHLRVLGDIEFLVILPHGRDYRALRPALAGWSRQVSQTLGEQGVRVDVEFGPAEESYLRRRARPSIFVYELRTHGRVVWGPADLLRRIPPFGADAIPRADAVHLIFNRAIEQLDAWDRVGGLSCEALFDVAYQRLKLRLDLAGSALAFAGRHVSAYAARPRAFAALLDGTPTLAALLPPAFVDDLGQAARAKLAPGLADVLPAGPPAQQRAWVRAEIQRHVAAVAAVLRWELGQLLGGDA